MKMYKTPRKKSKQQLKGIPRAELLKQLEELQETEKKLDKEINTLEQSGVKVTDAGDIMNALHGYNDIRDAIVDVFEFLGDVAQKTSAELHVKYNIPTE